jgi:hypothetical protein
MLECSDKGILGNKEMLPNIKLDSDLFNPGFRHSIIPVSLSELMDTLFA